MSRPKHRPKKEILREMSESDLFATLKYGVKSEIANWIMTGIWPDLTAAGMDTSVEAIEREASQRFYNKFRTACEKRDGSFFRELADGIEIYPRDPRHIIHPELFWVNAPFAFGESESGRGRTQAELLKRLKRITGRDVSRTHLKRLLSYIGRKAERARPGAPRKERGKVVQLPTASNGGQLKRRTG
jgi:hypothetical protein